MPRRPSRNDRHCTCDECTAATNVTRWILGFAALGWALILATLVHLLA